MSSIRKHRLHVQESKEFLTLEEISERKSMKTANVPAKKVMSLLSCRWTCRMNGRQHLDQLKRMLLTAASALMSLTGDRQPTLSPHGASF